MSTLPIVGVAGLGIMGLPMARHLVTAGFPVHVYNRSPGPVSAAHAFGAQVSATPRQLVEVSDIVITMLTHPDAIRAVLNGPDGMLAAEKKSVIWLQMSTLDVASTLTFAETVKPCGWSFVDCPVTGSKKQVEAAQLILLAGADRATLERVRPVLNAVGKTVVHAGDIGAGSALKLCMNLIVAQMTTAIAESASLGEALGIDPARIWDVLKASPALDCGYYRIKEEPILKRDYAPAFSLANMLKDVRFMLKEAAAKGQALPVTEAVERLMARAADAGRGAEDLAVVRDLLRPR